MMSEVELEDAFAIPPRPGTSLGMNGGRLQTQASDSEDDLDTVSPTRPKTCTPTLPIKNGGSLSARGPDRSEKGRGRPHYPGCGWRPQQRKLAGTDHLRSDSNSPALPQFSGSPSRCAPRQSNGAPPRAPSNCTENARDCFSPSSSSTAVPYGATPCSLRCTPSPEATPAPRMQQSRRDSGSLADFKPSVEDFMDMLQREPILLKIVKRMYDDLVAYNKANGVYGNTIWASLFDRIKVNRSGRLTIEELDRAIRQDHKSSISRYELRVMWRHLDAKGSGEVTARELELFLYRVELSTWPTLSESQLSQCVQRLNTAADFWHRSGGNWFKIFTELDADDSGHLSFTELQRCVRGSLPGLSQSTRDISEVELQGLWRALDSEMQLEVPVAKFMKFMRQHSGGLSMHKATSYSRNKRTSKSVPLVISRDELREVARKIENALKVCFSVRGLHEKGYSSQGSWKCFFDGMELHRIERLDFKSLASAVKRKLGRLSVSDHDLHALWTFLDLCPKEKISAAEYASMLYNLELEDWLDGDELKLQQIVDRLNNALEIWRSLSGRGGGWRKMFARMDSTGIGLISFIELKLIVRRPQDLGVSRSVVTDDDIRTLWKALDETRAGHATVEQFTAFMEKYRKANHSMGTTDQVSNSSNVAGSCRQDLSHEIASVPDLTAEAMCDVANRLTLAAKAWADVQNLRGVMYAGSCLWDQFTNFFGKDSKGRLTFSAFECAVARIMKRNVGSALSRDELMAFWRLVDENGSGEATSLEIDGAVYKAQLSTWPVLNDADIQRVVGVFHAAADHWHRAQGNWFIVFTAFDADRSGTVDFDELASMARNNFPGLSIPFHDLSNRDLQGFWRALDTRMVGLVTVGEFMVFMRKHGDAFSMHKLTEYSKRARSLKSSGKGGTETMPTRASFEDLKAKELASRPERSPEDLRKIVTSLKSALAAYWARRGVAICGWKDFLAACGYDKKRIKFQDLIKVFMSHLRSPAEKKRSKRHLTESAEAVRTSLTQHEKPVIRPPDASEIVTVVKGVSTDDLLALWNRADADGSGQISYAEWELCLYRIELHFWPDPDDSIIASVIEEMNAAAEKWHQARGNWFKVFRVFDTDNSYSVDFDEMLAMIRRPLPCLAIPSKSIPDSALQCFWKALDVDQSGNVTVQEFMVFMRRRSGQLSIRGNDLQNKVENVINSRLPPDRARLLCDTLAKVSYDTFVEAFDDWEQPFFGIVGEMDWFRFMRAFMNISETEISDDELFNAWSVADPGGYGEVTAEAILGLSELLKPLESTSNMDATLISDVQT